MILNPNSTTQSSELLREILPALFAIEQLSLFVRFTHHPAHAEEMVSGLTREDYDLIILLGGDGTVSEAINGLLGSADTESPAPETLPKLDRKSTRLNSSHVSISYAVFCLKKK